MIKTEYMKMKPEYGSHPTMTQRQPSQIDSNKCAVIQELLNEPGNECCADCNLPLTIENAWAVLSYGIFVCDDCKLVHIEHENYNYNNSETNGTNENSIKGEQGILSTRFPQLWEERDFQQIRNNGNKRTNSVLLASSPVWQYKPSGNDGIKLKELWIGTKYSGKAGKAADHPKLAAKKSFIGIQFIRPMSKGNYPCCAVLQNDKIYLTSDIRNEEISVECVETLILNSKRIGHESGVQLTYRINNDPNNVAFTYLQHDNMEQVLEWVNLVLYTKYNLLKRKYPTMIDQNVAKILNCGMVKESYMHVTGPGLIYLSLSEARLSCFKHHLDDKPLFQIAVSECMNLGANQYLDAVACFFDIEAAKIQSYSDWLSSLERVLEVDKIGSMPDDVPKPSFPFSLLKPSGDKSNAAAASTTAATNNTTDQQRNDQTNNTVVSSNNVATVNNNNKPEPENKPSIPQPISQVNSNSINSNNNQQPSNQAPPKINNSNSNDDSKDNDSKPNNYECYPPIGPMGEMGKVFRGELPPEAIKPAPQKTDLSRIYGVGEYITPLPSVHHLPAALKPNNFPDLTGNPTSYALTSYATTLNSVAGSIMNPAAKDSNCYPPIPGPVHAMNAAKIRYLQNHADIAATLQAAQMRRDQETLEESLRNNPAAAAGMLTNSLLQRTGLAPKPNPAAASLFDQARLQGLSQVGRFGDGDHNALMNAAGLPAGIQYPGWGDDASLIPGLKSPLLNVNGFDANRAAAFPGAPAGFPNQFQTPDLARLQLQAALEAQKLQQQSQNKPLPGVLGGSWGQRPPAVDLNQQANLLGRNAAAPPSWGNNNLGAAAANGMDQWNGGGGAKSPTSPFDIRQGNNFSREFAARILSNKIAQQEQQQRQQQDNANANLPAPATTPNSNSTQQNVIMENLLRQWKSAEQRLLSLIHNGYVPASDMSPAGLDKDSAEHAYTCVSELFELLWKQRYDLALSFLRGFREVFANSIHPEIRNLFIGVGELDTMKRIFVMQGKEKFLSPSSGGPVNWKQPTPPPPTPSTTLPSSISTSSADNAMWPTQQQLKTRESQSSPEFNSWGPLFSPSTSSIGSEGLWGAPSSTVASAASRSASVSSDPWSSSMFSGLTSVGSVGSSFNPAVSRPTPHARSSMSDNSNNEGSSFGSKASSNSTSPRVITPPTSIDGINSTSLAGIESTLKNIFLNSTE